MADLVAGDATVSCAVEQEQSFATNHMEDGVHIGKGTIEHKPEASVRGDAYSHLKCT